jgi:hypothetical protein
LLALLWISLRESARSDPVARFARVEDPEPRPPSSLALDPPAEERRSVEPTRVVEQVDAAEPTTLSARLRLDGEAVHGGWVYLASVDGASRWRTAIDFEGRFHLRSVPIEPVTLSFELPPAMHERTLITPTLELTPQPGLPLELELDWRARQINLRVLDADQLGSPAHVDVSGPHLTASLDTGPDGTARLAVNDSGHFRFHARARGGQEGEAELELEPGEDLDSVLVEMHRGQGER